ncbi:MAG: 50S ribosomal protein L10 [Deltaproteobacteria bacterium]|nr:50S ribosomal protein L10 [Deltaproteobacteria bacterium]
MNRNEKVAEVEELSGKFAKAKMAIVTDYKGLTVPVLQELRHNLRRNDAEFRVAKNTLLIRAVEDTEFKGLQDQFVGTTAITVSYGDPVSPAKILAEFAKDHSELQIRSALLDGKLLSPEDITALSKLPSKEILLGQMLSVMNGVPTGLVQVLSGVPRTFLYALQAIKEQKEQAAN